MVIHLNGPFPIGISLNQSSQMRNHPFSGLTGADYRGIKVGWDGFMPENEAQSLTMPEAPEEEKQLCLCCLTPNFPLAHFCRQCGAPLSPYAAIGPLERLYAEGFVYRQAIGQPRSLIVILGIWLLFGMPAFWGVVMILCSILDAPSWNGSAILGVFLLLFSGIFLWPATKNYLAGRKVRNKPAGQVNLPE